jgi:hypothetical protein
MGIKGALPKLKAAAKQAQGDLMWDGARNSATGLPAPAGLTGALGSVGEGVEVEGVEVDVEAGAATAAPAEAGNDVPRADESRL